MARVRCLFVSIMLLLLASACAAPPAAPTNPTLRVRFGADITSLDPAFVFGIESQTVAGHMFNGLLRYDDTSSALVPDLAERWEVLDGGRLYRFSLRSDVRWQRGYGPFSADDVVFSIERVRDPATASRYAAEFANIAAVSAIDSQTVEIRLREPDAGFLHKVAAFAQGMLVSRRAVSELGDAHGAAPVGTGPFLFEEHLPGQQVSLLRNPDYFGPAPAIDRIVFRVIPAEPTAELALRNGEIDILFAMQAPDVIARLRADPAVQVQERPANNTVNLVLNTTIAPLDNPQVRQAIAHAINRPALIEAFFQNLKTSSDTVLTPNFAEFAASVPAYAYDPQRARELLAAAGAEGMQLDLYSVALYPYDQIVVPIADDLRQIGIEPVIHVLDRAAYNEVRAAGTPPAIFTAIIGPTDPANVLYKLYHSASFPPGLNTAHYRAVDALLDQARVELDPERRSALYREVQLQAMRDLPVIPLYTDRLIQASRIEVRNLPQNALFTLSLAQVQIGP